MPCIPIHGHRYCRCEEAAECANGKGDDGRFFAPPKPESHPGRNDWPMKLEHMLSGGTAPAA